MIKCRSSEVRGGMADNTVLAGRQVIDELTEGDDVVVTTFAVVDNACMIEGAGGEGARRVANAAVRGCGHVICVFSDGVNTVAGCTVVDNASMVDKRIGERIGVVARPTIGGCGRMGGHSGAFARRANAVAIVVARLAGLDAGIDNAMIKDAAHVEADHAMAGAAIYVGKRVANGRTVGRDAMAGVTAIAHHVRSAVIRVSAWESRSRMAGTTFAVGDGVGWAGGFADGDCAVMAPDTSARNVGVVEAAIRSERQKMIGIVATVAFDICVYVELGFADGDSAVVAFAAVTEYFFVIDVYRWGKPQRRMTGCTQAAGCRVVEGLAWNVS